MGYKPGTGIGKKGDGRVDPVPIELKSGRSGLGKDSEMKRKAKEMNDMRSKMRAKRQRAAEDQKKSFMDRMSDKYSQKSIERDLRLSQTACFQLDKEQGMTEPGEPFFWPLKNLPGAEENKGEEEGEEELRDLEGYTRTAFQENPEDSEDELDTEDRKSHAPPHEEFSEFERLDILTRYLRNNYCYCIWCGTKYDDAEDLKSNCPGGTADAHD